ncbi:predicted protein [Sclerotinia sclerotiorum 1980 UF-70]|uniref:Uncharacterized protein n=2 Tax=Sclerotinia sclerotiorum (strain ATCC 18683 / 1980 / Ss-1) TaxID=665079 RepID=A7EM40_SCLS1|nr:predicted protein [Sclerotinia sclerotiorum 1980 UF-70]APA14474.1 hypothetical protein sscle_13g092440 [Sclerotinia sclerotiorum 1980 UF-70]EDO03906.1 predicted protein [Sclerotinia sclerotiorum 1980 UF-70]
MPQAHHFKLSTGTLEGVDSGLWKKNRAQSVGLYEVIEFEAHILVTDQPICRKPNADLIITSKVYIEDTSIVWASQI